MFRMKTLLIALVLILILNPLVALANITVNEPMISNFTDVKSTNPHLHFINYLSYSGIINGFSDGSYQPNSYLTRGQVAAVMVRALGISSENMEDPGFMDMSMDHWAYREIGIAVKAQLVKGFPDGSFRPDDFITRAEAVALILRLSGFDPPEIQINLPNDIDASHWAAKAISAAYSAGLIELQNGSFNPDEHLTRGEMARALSLTLILSPAANKRQLTGKLLAIKGTVQIKKFEGEQFNTVSLGKETDIVAGDTIRTNENSMAQILFSDGSGLLLEDNTEMLMEDSQGQAYIGPQGRPNNELQSLKVNLKKGKLIVFLASIISREDSEIVDETLWWRTALKKITRVQVDMPLGSGYMKDGVGVFEAKTQDKNGVYSFIGEVGLLFGKEQVEIKPSKAAYIQRNSNQTQYRDMTTDELLIFKEEVIKTFLVRGSNKALDNEAYNFKSRGEVKSPPRKQYESLVEALEKVDKLKANTPIHSGGGGYNGGSSDNITQVLSVTATPSPGRVTVGTYVYLNTPTSGANIYYTLDGNNPSRSSALYSTPIVINSNLVIKAMAVKSGMGDSTVSTLSYSVPGPTLPSNNADLSTLVVSEGSLSPTFNSNILDYTVGVANSVASLTVIPVASDTNARITINGADVSSSIPYGPISLNIGQNQIQILVTAEDGTVKNYTVIAVRGMEIVREVVATPNPGRVTVGTYVYLNTSTSGANIYYTLDGNTPGTSSISYSTPIVINTNTVVKAFAAKAGMIDSAVATFNYEVQQTTVPSNNASLTSLAMSEGSLSPIFDSNTLQYTATVSTTVSAITVTPTTGDSKASVRVNGASVNSGAASGEIALTVGANEINIIVTAEDGTIKGYKIIITRTTASAELTISRISISSSGTQGNSRSWNGNTNVSDDGRYIAFTSRATNFISNDNNGYDDVFVHDRQTGVTELISVSSDGVQGNGFSSGPSISADGRYVAFISWANNLVPNDTNNRRDIFLHDRVDKKTTLISVDSSGNQANHDSSNSVISADGGYVVFESDASNLVSGDSNSRKDIFLRDIVGGITTRVSVGSGGSQALGGNSYNPSISIDGRYIAFDSDATNIVANDTNGVTDVFVHDRQENKTTRVSVSTNGTQGDYESRFPAISGNGQFVVFQSTSTTLGASNGWTHIFIHDLKAQTTELVSLSNDQLLGDWNSYRAVTTYDGRYVIFESMGKNLVSGDTNNRQDIFVRDRILNTTTRLTVDKDGNQASGGTIGGEFPTVSRNGNYVAFEADFTNLVPNDTNGSGDVFITKLPDLSNNKTSTPTISNSVIRSGDDEFQGVAEPFAEVTMTRDQDVWRATADINGNFTIRLGANDRIYGFDIISITAKAPGKEVSSPATKTVEYYGFGTLANPYEIWNVAELNGIRNNLSAHYRLEDEIHILDCQSMNGGKGWEPIGNWHEPFAGSLDGNGFFIYGLYIARGTEDQVGLFGVTKGATIKRLGIYVDTVNGYNQVGSLVGFNENTAINQCYAVTAGATGTVRGLNHVGGLIGTNKGNSPINEAFSDLEVRGDINYNASSFGGLIGKSDSSAGVTNCYTTGNVTGSFDIGGLIGENVNTSVTNCYATGEITGIDGVGGLLGTSVNAVISSSFALNTAVVRIQYTLSGFGKF